MTFGVPGAAIPGFIVPGMMDPGLPVGPAPSGPSVIVSLGVPYFRWVTGTPYLS